MGNGTSIRKFDGLTTAGEGVSRDVGALSRNASSLSRLFYKPPPERRLAAGFSRSAMQSRSQTGAPPSAFQSGYEISGPSRDPGAMRQWQSWRVCGIKFNSPPSRRGRGAPPARPASANHLCCPPTGQCGDDWNIQNGRAGHSFRLRGGTAATRQFCVFT